MANEQGMPASQTPFVDERRGITPQWFNLLVSLWQRTGGGTGGGGASTLVLSGTIIPWPGDVVPAGDLECNGDEVSRVGYPDIFAVCGETWGPGNGTTTFNLPDFRARTLVGANDTTIDVGDYGGAASVTLSTAQLPAHSHGVNDPQHVHFTVDGGHTHPSPAGGTVVVQSGADFGVVAADAGANTGSATTGLLIQSAATGISIQNTGSGVAVPTQSPYAGVRYLIKT